jgi:hypothetical protein
MICFGCNKKLFLFIISSILLVSLFACSDQSKTTETPPSNQNIVGTWVLQSRIIDGQETPVRDRIMKLQFNSNGTFTAFYKGEESQNWIRAGKGGFSFKRPYINLYWESGQNLTLMAEDKAQDKMILHHGRNLAPLGTQEPEDVFVKQVTEKGPTK